MSEDGTLIVRSLLPVFGLASAPRWRDFVIEISQRSMSLLPLLLGPLHVNERVEPFVNLRPVRPDTWRENYRR